MRLTEDFSYIAGQIPSNMILNRVRPSLYMGGFCTAWSIVCLCTFLVKNFEGMLAARILLGVAEAPVSFPQPSVL